MPVFVGQLWKELPASITLERSLFSVLSYMIVHALGFCMLPVASAAHEDLLKSIGQLILIVLGRVTTTCTSCRQIINFSRILSSDFLWFLNAFFSFHKCCFDWMAIWLRYLTILWFFKANFVYLHWILKTWWLVWF